jgi:NDP-sugar pyrophosphorylase family protein
LVVKADGLAAGKGSRMASYSNKSPKSLLELKGEPLLARQMRSMADAGVRDFVIVGGLEPRPLLHKSIDSISGWRRAQPFLQRSRDGGQTWDSIKG